MADKDSYFGGYSLSDLWDTLTEGAKLTAGEIKQHPADYFLGLGKDAIYMGGMTGSSLPLLQTYTNPHFDVIDKIADKALKAGRNPQDVYNAWIASLNALTPAQEALAKPAGTFIPQLSNFIGKK